MTLQGKVGLPYPQKIAQESPEQQWLVEGCLVEGCLVEGCLVEGCLVEGYLVERRRMLTRMVLYLWELSQVYKYGEEDQAEQD